MYPLWQRGPVGPTPTGRMTPTGGSISDIAAGGGAVRSGGVGSGGVGTLGSLGSNGNNKYRRMAASVGDMTHGNGHSNGYGNGSYGNGSYGNGNRRRWMKGNGESEASSSVSPHKLQASSNGIPHNGANDNAKNSLFGPPNIPASTGSILFPSSNAGGGYNSGASFSTVGVGGSLSGNGSTPPPCTLNKANNSLWNRRRTNSTNNLPSSVFGGIEGPSVSPGKVFFANTGATANTRDDNGEYSPEKQARGSSASPRTPHSRGFWLQHPDDMHQQWIKTETPGSDIPTASTNFSCSSPSSGDTLAPSSASSPLTWPRRTSLASAGISLGSRGGVGRNYGRDGEIGTSGSDLDSSSGPAPMEAPATLPRVYKSQATWVRSPESLGETAPSFTSHPQRRACQMSSDGGGAPEGGEGGGEGGGVGDVMDFKHRVKKFQDKTGVPTNGRATATASGEQQSSNSQELQQQTQQQQLVKQSQQQVSTQQQQQQQEQQLQQHSVSMSNLSKLKSSMSEMKSSIDEMTASNSVFSSSNIQQASSTSQSKIQSSSQSKIQSSSQSALSSSKIQSSSQSALSSSKIQSSASTTALKSSKTSASTSKSVKSSKSTNALQSNFALGSSEKLAEQFQINNDHHHQNQLMDFKAPGDLLLADSSGLLPDPNSLLGDSEQFLNEQQPLMCDGEQLGSQGSLNGTGVTTFEQKKVTSSSKTKIQTDNNSFESATGSSSKSTRVQAGDLSYSECQKQAAARSKMEKNGVTEEKEAALQQEARQLKAGDDITHTEGSQKVGASMRVTGQDFSAHKSAVSEQQQRHTVTPAGTISEENSRKQSKSGLTITTKGVCKQQQSSMTSSQSNISYTGFEDFDLGGTMQPMDIQNAIMKYSGVMTKFVDQLKTMETDSFAKAPNLLEHMNDMMKRAWSLPTYGHELGYSLCKVLKHNGGLDILLENCTSDNSNLKFSSAKVLEQCLTTENRGYVVEKGLENVVNVACDCTQENRTIDQSRVGTGILEHLFKHSEGTCSDIIKLGGLEAVVRECRKTDVETLRHCAGALANLSLYGGSENQQAMVQRKVAIWLFPLAFHHDDNIKYYACLAIAALVANTEIEAQVLKGDTLSLIEPFVNSHLPEEFANSTVAHRHGQSRDWLERLVPVLSSKREEARNLAAFHFCMEAGIKKNQGNLEIFQEIDAIEPLKQVASSPNAIASKYAAHALRLMGEEVPHKLSQQVPLWQANDVQEWVKQIGFGLYADAFVTSRVDGDLLLQIGEENLQYDIGIANGILRQRFLRELRQLRQIADYSSRDTTGLNAFMTQLGQEYAEYTYKMLLCGASKSTLRFLSDEQLMSECGILNSIHRQRIKEGIFDESSSLQDPNQLDKNLDVFISYRRSNGSQLASLLKVHMQLKGFSVFIDVERLEAGKFDNNLLSSIRQARNFLLVLTPNALDRCTGDIECKDWVHKEIVAALESGCNIIPIIDNFHWPEAEQLPEDMRAVCYFNGVRWIHDYQDACVDKLERFMRGEGSLRGEPPGSLGRYQSTSVLTQPGTPSPLPRAQPIYQRTASTESGKGSSCSDKDYPGKD